MRDPYSVLGVDKSSDEKQIKSAFRKLAKKFHPDQNKDNPKAKDKFSEINTAYEILGDKEKKAQFDRGEIDGEGKPKFAGFDGFGGMHGARGSQQGFGGQQDFGGAEDILSQIFGGRGGGSPFGDSFSQGQSGQRQAHPRRSLRGRDIKAFARVTLEQLALGKADVKIGPERTVSVSIPAGTEDGQVIRLKGQGEQPPGGQPGDALVTIAIRPHKNFKRQGNDLRVDLPVDLDVAVLGGKVRVPTLTGAVSLTIPTWSGADSTFRIPRKGLHGKDGSVGDILVYLRLILPKDEDPELIALMKKRQDTKIEN